MSFSSLPEQSVKALAALLQTPKRIAITTHYNPDGDALGSCLGLAPVLAKMGHAVQVVLPNPAPNNLRWMPGHDGVVDHTVHKEQSLAAIGEAEVLFCLDFNRAERVNELEPVLRWAPLKVMIDHHRGPDTIFNIIFSDVSASSTCQLVHDVICAIGQEHHIDAAAATCLYAGIMTDSGSFRFPSTSAHTHRVTADLIDRGARPDQVYQAIMEDNTVERLKLTGYALGQKLEVLEQGQATLIALSKRELERFHFVPGDTEGLVNFGLTVRGVRLAAFLVERADGIKLSLRSKGTLPVNELLAQHFEGGGHANAAGGRWAGSLDEAVAMLKKVLPGFLAAHSA